MFIGIDLGTSGVKIIVLDEENNIIAHTSCALQVQQPHPLWSEQNPHDWWNATQTALFALKKSVDFTKIQAIGLSGQMHGATLLNKQGHVLRPAILWNDGRSALQCQQLEHIVLDSRKISGNLMMPGFTAPKLKWVQQYEPQIFKQISKVLLPKDYLRYRLSGDFASDMSDSSGTMWLDVSNRCWSDKLLQATDLSQEHMPQLFEGNQITGYLSAKLSKYWGIPQVPIIAGGGDNAAGAIGVGITQPNQAMLSLGTSGVYFVTTDGFVSNTDSAVHSFCHALPNSWHAMSVILSAASCINWVAKLIGKPDIHSLLLQTEQQYNPNSHVIFLPYLSGERTPHNDPSAKGVFWGMTTQTTAYDLVHAVLEGVSFALADGVDALHKTGTIPTSITLIGGGAQSRYWRQMLANILGITLNYRTGSHVGPALGAARLAKLALYGDPSLHHICAMPPLIQAHHPDETQYACIHEKRQRFQTLYQRIIGL